MGVKIRQVHRVRRALQEVAECSKPFHTKKTLGTMHAAGSAIISFPAKEEEGSSHALSLKEEERHRYRLNNKNYCVIYFDSLATCDIIICLIR